MLYFEGLIKYRREKFSKNYFGYLWENGVGCFVGMVFIFRVIKIDFLRLKLFGGDNFNF